MSIRKQEDELFREWEAVRERFVPDGLVDEAAYLGSSPRIVFVLKETNGFDGGDLRALLREGERAPTWTNITRWLMGIRALPNDLPWSDIADIRTEQRRTALLPIGAMNMKKSTGGHTTNGSDLWSVAHDDARFLQRQYAFYDPSLTVCCGSAASAAFRQFVLDGQPVEIRHTRRGVEYYSRASERDPRAVVLQFAHPEARVADSLLYYAIVDAVREILYPKETAA